MSDVIKLKKLSYDFSVCKAASTEDIDLDAGFCFVGRTDEEISVVCRSDCLPDNLTECDDGWRGFRIEGILDFSLIGILAEMSSVLADNKIGIFVVSTYNTDYVFVKKSDFDRAMDVLADAGYDIIEAEQHNA